MTTASPQTLSMTLPGAMLERGFWLYVWRVNSPLGEKLYVGRTGDNSSPHATAPYTRMAQHLGFAKNQNALRRHLSKHNIDPEQCESFELVAHGPIFPEVERDDGLDRDALMEMHTPPRNEVGALERELALGLERAGYDVLNTVKWNHPHNDQLRTRMLNEFAAHFPKLEEQIA